MSAVDKSVTYFRKQFYELRDQRDKVLASDLSPDERYRQSQAIQSKINALAKRFEARRTG